MLLFEACSGLAVVSSRLLYYYTESLRERERGELAATAE